MRKLLSPLFLFLFVANIGLAQSFSEGPKNGHLIIAGGALRDISVFDKFIELAGGKGKAHVIVVPTAGGNEVTEEVIARIKKDWKAYGAAKVSVLHTTDPEEANTEAFAQVIDQVGGVYFLGGRQWRLADSYLNTLVQKKLERLLERGGVIAGSSAGATIQGSYLARGDSKTNTIMMGDHEVGMGFVSNAAIDQHTLARNRQFDMFEILEKQPELLGIAIDENTAILVSGNTFEVMGKSYVLIYDGTYWDQKSNDYLPLQKGEQKFHTLRVGRKYDMKERKVLYN
jgi:cyanophycinase